MSDQTNVSEHRVTPLELFFDLVFVFAFTQVTTLLRDDHALFAPAGRRERDLLTAILRIGPPTIVSAALIVAAGFVRGELKPLLWLAALAIGLLGPLFVGTSGWREQPAHFIERHGLIVIIAIGESLMAIGLGASGAEIDTSVIVGAVFGLAVAAGFWLAHFDFFPIRAQQMLAD